jgi:iron(III) transport system substrate-binding protein
MKKNKVAIATSNGESADFVADGRYAFSLVDSDDAVNRIRQGRQVKMIYPDQGEDEDGCFIVPNVVLLVKGAPHAENGRKLMDYLLSKETEQKLAMADCAQIPLHSDVKVPAELKAMKDIKVMKVDYRKVAEKLIKIQPLLKQWVKQ